VIPYNAFPIEVRRLLYTTNAIEVLNAKLRGAGQGPFPNRRRGVEAAIFGLEQSRERMDHASA
jgi:putative transposase